MSKNNSEVFFEFNEKNLIISAFKENFEKVYFKNINIINNDKNFLENLDNNIKANVIIIEKILGYQINDVNLLLNLNKSINIKFNIFKKKEENIKSYEDILYLIQDARQRIIKNNKLLTILHILIDGYYIDFKKTDELIFENKSKNFSVDLKFVCYSSKDILEFKKIFGKSHLFINKLICFDYLKTLLNEDSITDDDMHLLAYKVILGQNLKEVQIVPKKPKNKGFFEKLFGYIR